MDRNENLSKLGTQLQPHQEELIQLAELAGIHANPAIFKIIIELLNMRVGHENIFKMLKLIRKSQRVKRTNRSTVTLN